MKFLHYTSSVAALLKSGLLQTWETHNYPGGCNKFNSPSPYWPLY